MPRRIIVVGGGAAGLMAAGRAAEVAAQHTEVVLLEKTPRLGSKLLLTGNGRCNLSHDCTPSEFLAHLGPTGSFVRNGLARFYVRELAGLLARYGVPTVCAPDGRVFPASNKASDVLGALQRYGRHYGVDCRVRSPAAEIVTRSPVSPDTLPRVVGVRLSDGTTVEAECVILATGGLSYPATGSTGDGYRLAAALGHTIEPLRPALVPLVTQEPPGSALQGVSLHDIGGTLLREGCPLASQRGDLLFTHFGVSGPLVLGLSFRLGQALEAGALRLQLDLLPDLSEADLDGQLQGAVARSGKSCYDSLLRRYLPRALAQVAAESNGIPGQLRLSQLTSVQRRSTVRLLKGLELTIVGTRPMQEAMITLGGVRTSEVDPRTMASLRVGGLYFAGEIIDVAGETGGYNLQIAFTTGHVAGGSAGSLE